MHPADLTPLAPFLSDVTLQAPWALLERFRTLPREHPDEVRRAALEIIGRLAALGVPVTMEEPDLHLSVPKRAGVSATGRAWRARALSGSRSSPSGVTAPLVSVSIQPDPETGVAEGPFPDLRGKFALTTAPVTGAVLDLLRKHGSLGVIAAGAESGSGSTALRRGAPEEPGLVAVAVSDGDAPSLIERARAAEWATVTTELTEGWFRSPVPLVRIAGTGEPGPFVLLHGHYDSRGPGVRDNALGTAGLLEIARVMWKHRDRLRRSVWIAWWPGHVTGADAGCTWFADRYAIDLYERCIARIGCLSPGLRGAAEYTAVPAMSEAGPWIRSVIQEVAGRTAGVRRPSGAAPFDPIGISGCLEEPLGVPDRPGEEMDSLEVVDRHRLLTDIRIHLAAAAGLANETIAPLDFRRTTEEFAATLRRYQRAAGKHASFEPVLAEVAALEQRLDRLAEHCASLGRRSVTDPWVRRANAALRRLGRLLVPVNFTPGAGPSADTGRARLPLPDLAPALELSRTSPDRRAHLQEPLLRGRNRVVQALRDASAVVRSAMP